MISVHIPIPVKLDDDGSMAKCAQQCVHPTGGSLRVFRQFAWLGVGSVKMAFSRPTHQRVTPAVRWHVFFLEVGPCAK